LVPSHLTHLSPVPSRHSCVWPPPLLSLVVNICCKEDGGRASSLLRFLPFPPPSQITRLEAAWHRSSVVMARMPDQLSRRWQHLGHAMWLRGDGDTRVEGCTGSSQKQSMEVGLRSVKGMSRSGSIHTLGRLVASAKW
jgi:hypothetical protein